VLLTLQPEAQQLAAVRHQLYQRTRNYLDDGHMAAEDSSSQQRQVGQGSVVGLLEDSRRVRKDPLGLGTGHSMVEAHWLTGDHNWGLLSFARLVGVMRPRTVGLEVVVEEEAAVAGAVELADSDSGLAWDSGTLGKGIGHGVREDLIEVLLGIASCALGEGS
jgi:hypothetical protein